MLKRNYAVLSLLPIYLLVLLGITITGMVCNKAIETIAESKRTADRHTIIIDPGHGGEDGGATSCTGVLESKFNLDIALRLNDLMHLLGMNTLMIRDTDRSIYTQGETIAQKKVSDLRERVRIINETDNAIVVSIHQNTFPDGQYWGTQVFYPNTGDSKELAGQLQKQFQISLTPQNKRVIKQTKGIYLMEHIQCTGILVECGFLSNPEEREKLKLPAYQQQMAFAIMAGYWNAR